MRQVPRGKLVTVPQIGGFFARQNGANFTEPMTAGIFVDIAAWAKGELNPKCPGGVDAQAAKLESEGHAVVRRGRKNLRWYAQGYENSLFKLG